MNNMNCHSELDESQRVDGEGVLAHYHMMTGSMNWAISLGQCDIQHAFSTLVVMANKSSKGGRANNYLQSYSSSVVMALVSTPDMAPVFYPYTQSYAITIHKYQQVSFVSFCFSEEEVPNVYLAPVFHFTLLPPILAPLLLLCPPPPPLLTLLIIIELLVPPAPPVGAPVELKARCFDFLSDLLVSHS
jgi:hypothetical protein